MSIGGGRPSMGPPTTTASRTSRPSLSGSITTAARPSIAQKKPVNRLSLLQSQTSRPTSISSSSQASAQSAEDSPIDDVDSEGLSTVAHEQKSQRPSVVGPPVSRTFASTRPTAPPKVTSAQERAPVAVKRDQTLNSTQTREIEDLKTKLRILEKKRMEDRDKLKHLEKIQGERDKFESIIQKLQAKYQPQQQEIAELKRRIKDTEAKATEFENQQVDIDTAVEMATLDREMAEETAEAYKTELEALRSKHEELELEVEVLREENSELGKEMSPEERTSQGWMQMERSNERLREALIRLRDMTQEQESDLKSQIAELESDAQDLQSFRKKYNETKGKLDHTETIADDLRQQLEGALGAEDMIEEITEKNMALTERIDELKIVIEDLESLKELNDELEVNHVETEKQLQEEIDYQEALYLEQVQKAVTQDETIEDLEYTVSRFRELVSNLQTDLEDMRASQQITETEANELSNRSRAMMDLNMRLQTSASKAQVKAVDLELQKLEAQESADHLAIVQLFLPDSYAIDRDSVNAYLRVKRIGFKSHMLHAFVKERVNGVAVLGHEDNIFAACDILDKLTWVAAMCARFVKFIKSSSLESFMKLEGALYDLEPVERSLNTWIDGLKRDDLKEQQCASDLQRSIALMSHLAENHISESLQAYADDVHMRALVMQSNLENAASAVHHIKAIIQTRILLPTDADESDEEEAQNFLQRAECLVSQIRSAKVVAGKAIHQLEELESRSLTLNQSTLPTIEQSESATSDFAASCRTVGFSVFNLFNEEGRTSSFTYNETTRTMSPQDSLPFASVISRLQGVTMQVQNFYTLTTTLSQTVEFPPPSSTPPWELLSRKLKEETTAVATQEQEIGRLKDEMSEKKTALAMKEKTIEEMGVRVEVLEKRVGESGGRREKLRELENLVSSSRSKEQEMASKLVRLEDDLRNLESERDTWKRQATQISTAGGAQPTAPGIPDQNYVSIKTYADIANLKSEISSLQSTIRYLRLSSQTAQFSAGYSFLNVPLTQPPSPLTKSERLAHEANDVLKSMLDLITHPTSQIVTLKPRKSADRLAWKPVRETTNWIVDKQKEDWESWKAWRNEVSKRSKELNSEQVRKSKHLRNVSELGRSVPGAFPLGLGMERDKENIQGGRVKIVKWDRVGRGFD